MPDLTKRHQGQLVRFTDGEQAILNMFDASGAGFTLRENGFDVQKQMQMLIDIAQHGEKDSDRLAALRMIDQKVERVAEVNGLIVKARQEIHVRDGEGGTVTQVQSCSRLLTTLQENPNDGARNSPFAGRTIEPILSREVSDGFEPDGDGDEADGLREDGSTDA